jgi:hypothetical protein
MGDWGLYSALRGTDNWAAKRQDRMQSIMIAEKQAQRSEMKLQQQMKLQADMEAYFDKINELDYLAEDQERITNLEKSERRKIYEGIAQHNGNLRSYMLSGGISQLGNYRRAIINSKEAKNAQQNKQNLAEYLTAVKEGMMIAPVTLNVKGKDGKSETRTVDFKEAYAAFQRGAITKLPFNGAVKDIDIKPLDFAKQSKNPANPFESAVVTAQDVKFKAMAMGLPEWAATQKAQAYLDMYNQTGESWHWNTDADQLLKLHKANYYKQKAAGAGKDESSRLKYQDVFRTKFMTLNPNGIAKNVSRGEEEIVVRQLRMGTVNTDSDQYKKLGGRFLYRGDGYLFDGKAVDLTTGVIRQMDKMSWHTIKRINPETNEEEEVKVRGVWAEVAYLDDDAPEGISNAWMWDDDPEEESGFGEESLGLIDEAFVGNLFIPYEDQLHDPSAVAEGSIQQGVKDNMAVSVPSLTDANLRAMYNPNEVKLVNEIMEEETLIDPMEAYEMLMKGDYENR